MYESAVDLHAHVAQAFLDGGAALLERQAKWAAFGAEVKEGESGAGNAAESLAGSDAGKIAEAELVPAQEEAKEAGAAMAVEVEIGSDSPAKSEGSGTPSKDTPPSASPAKSPSASPATSPLQARPPLVDGNAYSYLVHIAGSEAKLHELALTYPTHFRTMTDMEQFAIEVEGVTAINMFERKKNAWDRMVKVVAFFMCCRVEVLFIIPPIGIPIPYVTYTVDS
jgi:hypothetical protein